MQKQLIQQFLKQHGPQRSSKIVQHLVSNKNITKEAARKAVSRAAKDINKTSLPLPKREDFLSLEIHKETELYYNNLVDALRETNSIYGIAYDGIVARGGSIKEEDFPVISGSADNTKNKLPNYYILQGLVDLQLVHYIGFDDGSKIYHTRCHKEEVYGRRTSEEFLLNTLANWLKINGFASYNKISFRPSMENRKVGPYEFDLVGPCYLHPMITWNGQKKKQGFVVADVFLECELDAIHIKYFVRKIESIKSHKNIGNLLPILMAERFTSEAFQVGKEKGFMMVTPQTLLGNEIGKFVREYAKILNRAAEVVRKDPKTFNSLIRNLLKIDGGNLNIPGTIFELLAGYMLRRNSTWIEISRKVVHPKTSEEAEIDVYCQEGRDQTRLVECKAKLKGGSLSLKEVEKWLKKVKVQMAVEKADRTRQEAKLIFEIWTTGHIQKDALERLKLERQNLPSANIQWKDGNDLLKWAREKKEKHVSEVLKRGFLETPYSKTIEAFEGDASTDEQENSIPF